MTNGVEGWGLVVVGVAVRLGIDCIPVAVPPFGNLHVNGSILSVCLDSGMRSLGSCVCVCIGLRAGW
jgi:hypothetical protein